MHLRWKEAGYMTLATDALWQQQQSAVLPSEALKKRSGHTVLPFTVYYHFCEVSSLALAVRSPKKEVKLQVKRINSVALLFFLIG